MLVVDNNVNCHWRVEVKDSSSYAIFKPPTVNGAYNQNITGYFQQLMGILCWNIYEDVLENRIMLGLHLVDFVFASLVLQKHLAQNGHYIVFRSQKEYILSFWLPKSINPFYPRMESFETYKFSKIIIWIAVFEGYI